MRGHTLIVLLLLGGCTHVRVPAEDAATGPLVTPAALNADHTSNQIVRGAFGAREMTVNCVLTVRGQTLTIVGLTAMGVRAFTIRYDGQTVQVENDLPVPAQLTPERLLADVELVYWPFDALRAAFDKVGLKLTEPFARTRRLRRGNRLIAEVHYGGDDPWRGHTWLANLEYGYTLNIESTPLPLDGSTQ